MSFWNKPSTLSKKGQAESGLPLLAYCLGFNPYRPLYIHTFSFSYHAGSLAPLPKAYLATADKASWQDACKRQEAIAEHGRNAKAMPPAAWRTVSV